MRKGSKNVRNAAEEPSEPVAKHIPGSVLRGSEVFNLKRNAARWRWISRHLLPYPVPNGPLLVTYEELAEWVDERVRRG